MAVLEVGVLADLNRTRPRRTVWVRNRKAGPAPKG